jgi:hypothetical protein
MSAKSSKFAGRKNFCAMTQFRTALVPAPAPFGISHAEKLLLIGSCFSEHIGERLAAHKFSSLSNPFGIVYNPISMARSLERLLAENHFFAPFELFEHDGLWHSWEHHGRFSKPEKSAALSGLNTAYAEAATWLKTTNRLLLTFGSADVFVLRDGGQIVANNHKMPAAHFEPRRLSVAEIVEATVTILQKIKIQNPDLQIVVTVSPVRHLRGGLVENQRSKATLVLACEAICRQLPFAHYFPAYELLLDDLRDYRFYANDLLHPSELAVDYVWQFFEQTFFSEKTQRLNERVGKIRAAAQHRPFHAGTPQYQAFARAQLAAIEALLREMPGLDFGDEIARFRSI